MVLFRWDPNWGVNCSCSKSQVCRSLLTAIEGEEVPDETSKFLMPWFPVFPFISFIHSSCLMCLHLCFSFNYQDRTELVESCFIGDHCWRALHIQTWRFVFLLSKDFKCFKTTFRLASSSWQCWQAAKRWGKKIIELQYLLFCEFPHHLKNQWQELKNPQTETWIIQQHLWMQDVNTRDFCKFALVQHGCITMNSAALQSPSAPKILDPTPSRLMIKEPSILHISPSTIFLLHWMQKKLALTKLCYVFCFKGSHECDVWFHNTAMYVWFHRWTMQCVHESVYHQCNVWSPYVLGSICTWIPKFGLHRQIVQRCCSKGGKENWSNVAMDCMCCSSWAESNSCCREVFVKAQVCGLAMGCCVVAAEKNVHSCNRKDFLVTECGGVEQWITPSSDIVPVTSSSSSAAN